MDEAIENMKEYCLADTMIILLNSLMKRDAGKNKIVVWWKHGGEIGDDFACGDTPKKL